MTHATRRILLLAAALLAPLTPATATAQNAPAIGVITLHGKGGGPGGLIKPLADGLAAKGFSVMNLDMTWSNKRRYDKDVNSAIEEVRAAAEQLRGKGAKAVFVAGHSQGAVFAIHYATRHKVDGLVIIAPGGDVSTSFYRQQVAADVSKAREMVNAGKGGEVGEFDEVEGNQRWTVRTTAATYLEWFDPEGAMNQLKSSAALPRTLPVLHVAPRSDYPSLLRAKQEMFSALPDHPLRRLHEPSSNHRNAPRDSVDEIAGWITEVAGK